MLTRELLASYIDAGAGRIKADMAVMGGTLINVNTGEYYQADVAIYKGKITAVEKDISDYVDDHTKIIDAKGKYLAPGLIDCHVHVECSKMSMTRFAEAVCRMAPRASSADLMNIFPSSASMGSRIFSKRSMRPL